MSCLVDQYGQPMGSRLLNASRQTDARPNIAIPSDQSFRKLVNFQDWRTVSHISTILYGNYGITRAAIHQKATWSVGESWHPVFLGEAAEWGKRASDWLINDWYPVHDIMGPMRDFQDGLVADSIEIDRGGDAWILLTETETGWPQVQRIRPSQIGQRSGTYDYRDPRVKDGPFQGQRILHGVIFNAYGRPIGARILGETPEDDQDVSFFELIQVYDPEFYDQPRGLPAFYSALEDIQDAMHSAGWERLAMLQASAISLLETNETGAPDSNDPINLAQGAGIQSETGVHVENLVGGLIKYFRAKGGGKLEQFKNQRPGEDWERHQDRIVRSSLAGIGWPYSFVWKREGSGTDNRGDQELARASVLDRQATLRYPATRMCGYAVSKAIKLKLLPPYPGKDAGGQLKWGHTLPPLISIDSRGDRQEDRADYILGRINLTDMLARDGKTLEPHLRRRAQEEILREKIRMEESAKAGIEIEPRWMRMLNPNEMADPAPDTQPTK